MRHGIEFADPLTPNDYRNATTMEAAAFDLYLLFSGRGEMGKANAYATPVQAKVDQYRRGSGRMLV